ncbi:MAG: histidine phosphatase family protein [Mycobacterium sp.]
MPSRRQYRSARPSPKQRLRYIAVALLATALLFFGAASAWAAESITLDFVRHGEAGDNLVINNEVPGPPLTVDGVQQADSIAHVLAGYGIDGIYASAMTRAQESAAPLSALLGLPVHDFSGLNEIDAGIFAGLPVNVGDLPIGAALYALAPFLWTLGLYSVPQLGSSDFDGMAFQDRFGDAVQTIYNADTAGGADNSTDAVFSHEGSIAIWALMNVNNPDFSLVLTQVLKTGELLPYTGIVEIQGNPEDGWNLVSWDGQAVPQDPGLPTELFVDLRNLITAPQMAAYHIWEALLTGDNTAIMNTIQSGFGDVFTATAQFPLAVISDFANATADATGLPSEVGQTVAAAVASL